MDPLIEEFAFDQRLLQSVAVASTTLFVYDYALTLPSEVGLPILIVGQVG